MNDIRPFRGLRFDETIVGALGDVVCPPYDVISPDEQSALHDRSPHNVVRLELGFEKPGDDASNNRYSRAAATLERWLAERALREEKEPAFYLYEQQFAHDGRMLARLGLLTRLRLASWEEGVVLPHEETMAGPKADRLRLMKATACNLSPLYLLFDDPTERVQRLMVDATVNQPDAVADTGDGQLHRLWALQGTTQMDLAEALQGPQLYMADGHHRYETALAYRDEMRAADPDGSPDAAYNFAMVLLVDARDPGLVVLPTHRLVRGIDPTRVDGLDSALRSVFEVETVEPDDRDAGSTADAILRRMRERELEGPALGIYRQGGSGAAVLRLRTLPERGEPGARPLLDVDVLHDMLLAPLMGIGPEQLRAGTHVGYTRDAVEAVDAVNRGEAQVAFLLNPTEVDQVLQTARAHGKMPQKSTYFFPKPTTGLVINPLR